jgi:hypothetical protein
LSDLLVLGPARIANVQRIHGGIWLAKSAMRKALAVAETVQMGPYVEGELANLNASVLKDEGMELLHAEQESDHAIKVFAKFDSHLAARAMIVKAETLRLHGIKSYTDVLHGAIPDLDERRDAAVVEVAWNNSLRYLVEQGKIEEARRRRKTLPWPTIPNFRASRAELEGCIDLAEWRLGEAKSWFSNSIQWFTDLERVGDAEIGLLYSASVYATERNLDEVRTNLEAAERIATGCGYFEAATIRKLLRCLEEVDDLADQIVKIAFEAGGCLGPRKPRH